jgi:hypothetical protein
MRFWKRAWPWLVGAVILGVVATRVPLEAFRTAMTKGPHLELALINIAINVASAEIVSLLMRRSSRLIDRYEASRLAGSSTFSSGEF